MPATPPITAPADRVLGLFAKQPIPGQVKTRLAAETSPEWAARVAAAFLHDLLDVLGPYPARRILAFAPAEAEGYFAALVRGRFALRPQCPGDLGSRMAEFFTAQFRAGARQVVLLGSDSPTIPPGFIEQAFRELERSDVVLGPAADGGYYLIGCARRTPSIFTGIVWGGCRVLMDTIARIRSAGLRLALLPPWYDVDTLADWHMLTGHLAALRCSGTAPRLPMIEALPDPPRKPE